MTHCGSCIVSVACCTNRMFLTRREKAAALPQVGILRLCPWKMHFLRAFLSTRLVQMRILVLLKGSTA